MSCFVRWRTDLVVYPADGVSDSPPDSRILRCTGLRQRGYMNMKTLCWWLDWIRFGLAQGCSQGEPVRLVA